MPPPVRTTNTPKKSESIVRNVIRKRNPVSAQEAMTEVPTHEAPLVLKTEAPTMVKVEDEPDSISGEMPEDRDEIIMSDGSRRVRRRKKKLKKEKSKALLIFIFVWMTIIASVFYLYKTGDDSQKDEQDGPVDGESIIAARNRLFIGEHFPQIYHLFTKGFLGQFESGRRLQFIDQSSRLSLQFNRFYRTTVFPKPEGEIGSIARNVIEIKSGPDPILGLETIWQDEEGNRLETVHVHDGKGWRLDWEAFGPYSTSPWVLFISQSERSEGTFRLYVRKMKSLDDSKRFFVKFYPPSDFGDSDRKESVLDVESPEVEINTRSDLGQKFIEMIQNHKDEKYFLGSMFPRHDPSGYMRVTVKLAWESDDKEQPVLALKEVLSSSWYGQRIVDAHEVGADEDDDPEKKDESEKESESEEKKADAGEVKPILKDE